MDVSIIVVAWNVRELLGHCLRSVYQETRGIEFEVIYVDNGSVDGSLEMVRQEFPQARIIANKDNKGFIRANNQAIEVANGRYVLLLNSDTIVLENAIAKTLGFADQHPEAAVVGCRVLNPDRTLQESCFRFYSTLNMLLDVSWLSRAFPRNKLFGRKIYGGWDYDTTREVDVVVGCFSLVRMAAIRQVGVMDERFFVYGDDIDWCYRFVKAGWKVLFAHQRQDSLQLVHVYRLPAPDRLLPAHAGPLLAACGCRAPKRRQTRRLECRQDLLGRVPLCLERLDSAAHEPGKSAGSGLALAFCPFEC
jgi:hypothetical protein